MILDETGAVKRENHNIVTLPTITTNFPDLLI